MTIACPVCGSTEFRAVKSRPTAACARCGCFERHRLLWLYIDRLKLLASCPRTLHFAPERHLQKLLQERLGANYLPVDLKPERMTGTGALVARCDMCTDLPRYPDSSFDLIIHNHVLEHIPCSPFEALKQLRRVLRFGGIMLFSIPISGPHYREDLSPTLTDDDRARMFGQGDHVRLFGQEDVLQQLEECLGQSLFYDAKRMFGSNVLAHAAIPDGAINGPDSSTIFVFRKL